MGNPKYDKDFKQKVFKTKIFNVIREQKRAMFDFDNPTWIFDDETGEANVRYDFDQQAYLELKKAYQDAGLGDEFDCVERLLKSAYRRKKRINLKIFHLIVTGKAIFVTLNFNDETLFGKDGKQRRRLVQRFLKKNAKNYVANIDFGKLNDREHYHAIVDSRLDFTKWYKYGGVHVMPIRNTNHDIKRVISYVAKLTNHAIKNRAFLMRLIYSRNVA